MEKEKITKLLSEIAHPVKQLDMEAYDSLLGDIVSLKSRITEQSTSESELFTTILNKTKRLRFLEEQLKNDLLTKIHTLSTELIGLSCTQEMLTALFETGKLISQSRVFEKTLRLIMDKVIEVTGAEKGFLIVRSKHEKYQFEIARNNKAEDIPMPESEVSRNIIEKVFTERVAVCTTSATIDSALGSFESVMDLGLTSVLCVPIEEEEQVLGIIYLDNRKEAGIFQESTIRFVNTFGEQVVLALKNWIISRDLELSRNRLEEEVRGKYSFSSIIGNSPSMLHVLNLVGQVAATDTTVLLEGESGTGKELVAKAIHFNSERKNNPLVTINSGAIPDTLLESELFGHVKGAFTGADKDKKGKFEIADGGTVFLDEIGELNAALQVKLLRVLQFHEFSPIGSNELKHSDVRIIAATNRNLRMLVEEKKFRDDLYYRLNVFRIELPPLRERKEDIPLLINHFLQLYAKGRKIPTFSPAAERILLHHEYRGNLRELENAIQRALILCKNDVILPEDLPVEMTGSTEIHKKNNLHTDHNLTLKEAKETFEKEYLKKVLKENNWIIRQAAKAANIDVKNFHTKMMQYGIKPKK